MRKNLLIALILVGGIFSADFLVQAKLVGQKRMFTVTGYYSPLPDQSYFLTGSYQSEIRLNGQGKAGADSTPVYPGMIAAPKNYVFGTKVCLPSFGCGTVHDRGGAIVTAGQRKLAQNDRLDLWLGHGDAGLRRALAWGVRNIEGEIFAPGSAIEDQVNFSAPSSLDQILGYPAHPYFMENLSYQSRGEVVTELQEALAELGFYVAEIDGYYSLNLQAAVLKFQLAHFVVDNGSDQGAGRFGPQTRQKLAENLYHHRVQVRIQEMWSEFRFEALQKRGQRNADVAKLQKILVKEELLAVAPTGFFGPLTEEALEAFQLKHGIIRSTNQNGAGQLGPQTRAKLNEFLTKEAALNAEQKTKIVAYQKVRNYFNVLAQTENDLSAFVQK